MNYGWARDYALELILQHSIAGKPVALDYNNQIDYVLRIPKLIDDAQTLIATTSGKIREVIPISQLPYVERGGWREYTLPWNCWKLSSTGLIRYNGSRIQRFHQYHPVGSKRIAVPAEVAGDVYVEYYRLPSHIGSNPPDDAELDNSIPAQQAVPFYVAAHLVMYDNAFAYSALMNEFNDKLANLMEPLQTDVTVTEDSYSAREWDLDGYNSMIPEEV